MLIRRQYCRSGNGGLIDSVAATRKMKQKGRSVGIEIVGVACLLYGDIAEPSSASACASSPSDCVPNHK